MKVQKNYCAMVDRGGQILGAMAARCLLTVCLMLFFIDAVKAEQRVYDINLPAQAVEIG